ncbi:MAG: hypothetical protein Kow0089_08230 [Desulfobulbaceae bacterium]
MEQLSIAMKRGPAARCNVFDYCAGNHLEEVRCWEVARSQCDFHYVFNVCDDCIVYLYQHDTGEVTRQDIERILRQREPVSPSH